MIDQIIPRYLTTNEDERLVGEGAMIQAKNVSFVEDGEGTAFILKNAKGTVGATANTSEDQIPSGKDLRVIGSVSDSQRGFIYFFVCSVGDPVSHGIYQYNTSDDTYRVVVSGSWLNFQKDQPVKADVVNRNFQQDDILQTVLYFTDNYNPPRKVNVDRAFNGDYDFQSNNMKDHAMGVIKAPLVSSPTFSFGTDYTIKVNNFIESMFQFTTQLVYKDGEESALSPYSRIAIASNIGLEGLDDPEDLSGSSFLIDNYINITIPYSSVDSNSPGNRPEVILIRLYGRKNNNGTWLLLDEFDPSARVKRDVYGSPRTIYDPDTNIYTFYNEGVYSAAPDELKNKTYDNVPLKAEGQTIAGNRLMYSNYVEGRANVVIPEGDEPHGINVLYNEQSDGTVTLSGDDESSTIFVYTDGAIGGQVDVDMSLSTNYPSDTSLIPDASVVEFRAKINPRKIDIGGDSTLGGDSRFKLWGLANPSFQLPNLTAYANDNLVFKGIAIDFRTAWDDVFGGYTMVENEAEDEASLIVLEKQFVVGSQQTSGEVLQLIKEYVETVEKEVEYAAGQAPAQVVWTSSSTEGWDENDQLPQNGDVYDLTGLRFVILWGLTASISGNKLSIKPYPKEMRWTEVAAGANSLPSDWDSIIPIRSADQFSGNALDAVNEWDTDGSGNFSLDSAIMTSTGIQQAESLMGGFTIQYIDPSGVSASNKYLQEPFIQIEQKTSILSFKSGANHSLGVVYYDKYGRHGFVNKIGQFYVKTLAERNGTSQGYGAATAQVVWNHDAPSWASRWSIVYPGNSSFYDFTQYTVGSAFVPVKDDNDTPDLQKKRVYLSLNTLDKFKADKSPLFDYSYTKGDRLRVVSHRNVDDTADVYPGSEYPIEFNVVDVVTLGDTNNPLAFPDATGAEIDDIYKGTFLVLDAPNINGGAVDESGDQIRYTGFDWNSVGKGRFGGDDFDYPDGTPASAYSRWHQGVLVEIVTPKQVEPTVYYETGIEGDVKNYGAGAPTNHGPSVTFAGGESHLRTRSCAVKKYDSQDTSPNGWGFPLENDPADYVYTNKPVESKSASDFFVSDSWSKGKPHVSFERAAEVRRYNGITYSDAYEEDVSNLSLSSFNASLANFSSFDSRFGAARVILNYDNDLLCLQENKVSRANVGQDVLRTASQDSLVSLSTTVVGPPTYYQGDYGIGTSTESVLLYDGDLFFADASRRKVLRFNPNSGGVLPISDTDVSSLFDKEFSRFENATGTKRILSGYDPRTNCYYVSFDARDDTSYIGRTVSYDLKMRKWRSEYSFIPDAYETQNRSMYSCRYVDQDESLLFHVHKDNDDASNRNTFYNGSTSESVVEVVSKVNPHMVKVFNALSLESDEAWDARIVSSSGQDTGAGNMPANTFEVKEGQFYRGIPSDTTSLSTSHYHSIGTAESVNGRTITFSTNIHRTPIPKNALLMYILGDEIITIGNSGVDCTLDSREGPNKITTDVDLKGNVQGKEIVYVTDQSTDGDKIRGHYAKIKLTNTSDTLTEIFSVNTHYTNSRLNHALGQ
jgi:hypothetical protein